MCAQNTRNKKKWKLFSDNHVILKFTASLVIECVTEDIKIVNKEEMFLWQCLIHLN